MNIKYYKKCPIIKKRNCIKILDTSCRIHLNVHYISYNSNSEILIVLPDK